MKRRLIRFLALSLLVLLLIPLASCSRGSDPADTTAVPSEESTTDASVTNAAPAPNVTWSLGYVGSGKDPNAFAYMVNPDGVGYSYSSVITVEKAGTKVYFLDPKNGETEDTVFAVSTWIQISGKWMAYAKGANIEGGSELITTATADGTLYSYVTSKDGESIRFCYRSGQTSQDDAIDFPVVRMEPTDEPGTSTLILSDAELLTRWIEDDKTRAYYDVLEGKTLTIIGDSYFGGSALGKDKVWPKLLARKYDMLFNNYGIGGSTVSNFVTTHNPMVDRYGEMIQNKPDIVIVEGGRNDYNLNVPLGELEDTTTKTFMGATRYLLTKIRQKYPYAVIIGLTCWETGGSPNKEGHYCREYGEAMLAVCADMGIPCINALDQKATGVYMTDPDFRGTYCQDENDVSHLNLEGMKLVMPPFEKMIYDIYTEEISKRGA